MISYIRHDEQFYGAMKLTTGDEILGEILVTEDPETKTDLIFVQNPAKTKVIELDADQEKKSQKVAMGFIRWMNFAEEDFYVVSESHVMTIAPMSDEAKMMYKRWVKKEIHKEEDSTTEVPMNESMGLISTVDKARQMLENLYKS
jgi:hypothetical protein